MSLRFVVAVLGVWRITHLLVAEDGPWGVVVRLRRAAGAGLLGEVLDCFQCLSLWIAAPFAYATGTDRRERAMLWPALSAGAVLIERIADGSPVAAYHEDPGGEDVLR